MAFCSYDGFRILQFAIENWLNLKIRPGEDPHSVRKNLSLFKEIFCDINKKSIRVLDTGAEGTKPTFATAPGFPILDAYAMIYSYMYMCMYIQSLWIHVLWYILTWWSSGSSRDHATPFRFVPTQHLTTGPVERPVGVGQVENVSATVVQWHVGRD